MWCSLCYCTLTISRPNMITLMGFMFLVTSSLLGYVSDFMVFRLDKRMGYIGAHGVAALHRYKYSGVDHSYLAKYVLQPFWTRFVKVFPLWMP
ncbi:hypothetical protein F2Q69_00026572 [Brassica cretica]|uniref:Uncharacterized protein n=1 Tax=Brassica cretica TaxID=69181 RepID=A0A8S9RZN2_BRACR|nr:hypothetical protein F2Q69_00026572 [Brassica cretica]